MRLFGKGEKHATVSSLLNILGLTSAFAALYVILVQVHHDLAFNHSVRDSERVYLVLWTGFGAEPVPWACRPLAETVVAGTPGIECGGVGNLKSSDGYVVAAGREGGSALPVTISEFSAGGRDALGIELVAGSWDGMVNGTCYALSESTARRLGVGVGDTFKLRTEQYGLSVMVVNATVAAIYADPPRDSDMETTDMFTDVGNYAINLWSEWSSVYFVRLHEGVAAADAEREMSALATRTMQDNPAWEFKGTDLPVRLLNLRDTFFSGETDGLLAGGSRTTTWALLGIAVLIVAIAFINYVNFFFAQIPVRLREVNTRKIFGCSRSRLAASFVGESLLMVLLALGLAALLVTAFGASPLAGLISAPTAFALNPWPALLTVVLGVVFSVAASLYPARYITSFNPAFALKGSLGSVSRGKAFRAALIGFQFAVSTLLIVCAVAVHRQRAFMLETDMGFDSSQVLTVKTSWSIGVARERIGEALANDPSVVDIAWGDGEFIRDHRMTWSRDIGESNFTWQCYPVSWNFLQFMGIEVVEGRDFAPSDEQSKSGVTIFNEAARDAFGVLRVGMGLPGHTDASAELAGICRNFHYASLHNSVTPLALYVMGRNAWRPLTQMFVKTAPGSDIPALAERLRRLLSSYDADIAPEDLEIRLLDSTLQAQYAHERSMSQLMILFTALAIAISLMGVFGLVMFETAYRRKEIGIRRVNGATVAEILRMFAGRFVRIVAVSFVVAVPLAYAAVDRYLMSYPYRIGQSVWVFAGAMCAVLTVTLLVVTLRSWHAATANPVDSLKNE